ncbi:MAG TPA: hypothetical protein VM598_06780 [Bdellovibrionota bacterium]|nr:hypothetical protein [Bdellovibrionota bacterium]
MKQQDAAAKKPIRRQAEPPTSIEHQLDMEEAETAVTGDRLSRGDVRPLFTRQEDRDPRDATEISDEMNMDMSEGDREGSEQSGDDHSSGLQGSDPDLRGQPHISSGYPGEETEDEEGREKDLERRRIDRP